MQDDPSGEENNSISTIPKYTVSFIINFIITHILLINVRKGQEKADKHFLHHL